jgi:ABC-2 type transport system ATP-binding protein
MLMLAARDVTKRYGDIIALNRVSLELSRGEVFGLLGSNGAGKTTLMKIFATLLRPDSGVAVVGNADVVRDPLRARRLIGFVPENPSLYDKLTGREFLNMIARLRNMKQADADRGISEMRELFRMGAELERESDGLSRGMKQKLAVSSALFHRPPVLILDEPTNGLDPRFAKVLKEWLKEYARAGNTILLSTHVTQVAEAICDRIAIIHDGGLVALGSVKEVCAKSGASTLEDAFTAIVGDS